MPEQLKISEIMSADPVVVDVEDSVQDAAILMRKNNISGLVVVEKKSAIAIVTMKDIAKKVVAENLSARDVKIKEVMSSDMITATDDEDATGVAMKMAANSISRVPILDSEGNIAGVVTKTDILRTMPGLVNTLYEKENAQEIIPESDRVVSDGICEECGNHSDELTKVDEKWICQVCEELKNA